VHEAERVESRESKEGGCVETERQADARAQEGGSKTTVEKARQERGREDGREGYGLGEGGRRVR
jgi:hypothetical protein